MGGLGPGQLSGASSITKSGAREPRKIGEPWITREAVDDVAAEKICEKPGEGKPAAGDALISFDVDQ